MANVASAEKRNRQRIKRRARNQFHLSTMRTYVKRVRAAIEAKDGKVAEMPQGSRRGHRQGRAEGRDRQEGRGAQDLPPHHRRPRQRVSRLPLSRARFARVSSSTSLSSIRASSRRDDLKRLSARRARRACAQRRGAIESCAPDASMLVDEERRDAERLRELELGARAACRAARCAIHSWRTWRASIATMRTPDSRAPSIDDQHAPGRARSPSPTALASSKTLRWRVVATTCSTSSAATGLRSPT